MGFGAAKPGSTLPPQGGKGGVQPQTPTGYYGPIRPSMNQPAQVPPQGGKFPGSSLPPQGGKSQADQDRFNAQIIASQNQPPYRPIGNPIQPTMQQPQVPPQGGKFPGSSLPPQGGKSQADQDRFNAQIIASQGVDQAKIMNAGKGNAPVQPTVPAQGGKFPGNPQQPTTSNIPGYAQPYVNALNPQAQQPVPGQVPSQLGNLNLGSLLYGNGGGQQPTVQPTQPQIPAQGGKGPALRDVTPEQLLALQSQLDATRPMPQVMPRPVPQVMPRQPTPKPAPQGIAGISQRINQMRQRGRR